MGSPDLIVRALKVTLAPESRVDGHYQEQIEIAHHLFGMRQRRAGIEHEARHHARLLDRIELPLHVNCGFGMEREHGCAGRRKGFDVVLGLHHHQVHIDRLVGQLAQRLDHVGAERDVGDKSPVHHVHVQPVGSRGQDLRDLFRQSRQIGREHAGCDADAVRRHCGLRATTMSTTVPGAASVPAAGRWATTVPGDASAVRRRVTVPSCSPSVSSLVRASPDAMPRRSGMGIVGAPRLMTTVTLVPGGSAVPAGGRVSITSPVGAAAWTDSTWLATNPAAAISDCASPPSRFETSGTGILGGPALATRVIFVPSGAMTPGGGSCHTTIPAGAVGCGSAPPSVTCSLDFWISACASAIVSPSTRGTSWWPGRKGAGKRMRYAVRYPASITPAPIPIHFQNRRSSLRSGRGSTRRGMRISATPAPFGPAAPRTPRRRRDAAAATGSRRLG